MTYPGFAYPGLLAWQASPGYFHQYCFIYNNLFIYDENKKRTSFVASSFNFFNLKKACYFDAVSCLKV